MPYPKTTGDLQQFTCAANWLRESIVGYAEAMQPLQTCLDNALRHKKKLKRVAAKVPIEMSSDEQQPFDKMKSLLATSATLHHPSPTGQMVLLTDASNKAWSIIVTQVETWKPGCSVADQQHQLLTCLSGVFTGFQNNWSVIEKEALPIVTACEKLTYLLLRLEDFRLYCDHRNLIHVFAPGDDIKKHVRGKLLRWAMKLTEYRYQIYHIAGESNVWADLLTRWGHQHTPVIMFKRVHTRRGRREQQLTLRPLDADAFVWPTLAELEQVQFQHAPRTLPHNLQERDDGLIVHDARLWVPAEATQLVRRLMIIAHCGQQGHRGRQPMMTHLSKLFYIPGLRKMVDKFLASCLLCHHVKGGKVVPRPRGETFRADARNDALHWDFLHLGKSFGPNQYVLALKDNESHFCNLVACETPTSTVVAEAILQWHARFGAPRLWISDQGTHFKNRVVDELCTRMKSQQSFSMAYCPWVNGSIERLNRDIVRVLRTNARLGQYVRSSLLKSTMLEVTFIEIWDLDLGIITSRRLLQKRPERLETLAWVIDKRSVDLDRVAIFLVDPEKHPFFVQVSKKCHHWANGAEIESDQLRQRL